VAVLFAALTLLLAPPASASPQCPDFVLEPTVECPGVPDPPPEQPPAPPDEWMAPPPGAPPAPQPTPAPEPPNSAVRCRTVAATNPYYLVPDNIDAGRLTFTVDFCLTADGRIAQATARDADVKNVLPSNKGRIEDTLINEFFGQAIPPGGTPSATSVSFTVEAFIVYLPPRGRALEYRDDLTLTVFPGGEIRQSLPHLVPLN
jgi:hypothetical protein